MRKFTSIAAAAVVAFGGASNVFADAEVGQGYFSVMGSFIDDDKDRGVEDAFNGGQISMGYAFNEAWNIEGMLSAAIPESDFPGRPDQNHMGLGLDLQRVFMRSERFSPYLHVGVGYFSNDPSGGDSKMDGAMYSGGLGFNLDLFSSNVSLRGEWRHRMERASVTDMEDDLFSIGLQIPFGPASSPVVAAYSAPDGDGDNDGVADSIDRCPETVAGARVDTYGCELDSDGDGVKDSMDKCPGTVAGATVDAQGCELDGDNDGVVDRLDECPNSAPGVQVDVKGCEIKAVITLRGVNFETNSDRLLPGATGVLDDAAATLRMNPTIKVEVAGHTDSDGAAAYNESLSARRAATVHDYLVSKGVADDRMTVRGYGESQPVADNTTSAGKAQNRRVVLRITDR
jgi:OOP family OmpA-OmpF porin